MQLAGLLEARTTISDGATFPTPWHLTSYAGLAPVTRRSGSSIRGGHPNRAGTKRLKNASSMSACAALRSNPKSRTYCDRKRARGKKHNTALIWLARRRLTHIGTPANQRVGRGPSWTCDPQLQPEVLPQPSHT